MKNVFRSQFKTKFENGMITLNNFFLSSIVRMQCSCYSPAQAAVFMQMSPRIKGVRAQIFPRSDFFQTFAVLR